MDTAAFDVSVIRTEDLDADQRAEIIDVCIAAHDEEDFHRLFHFVPEGGRHFVGHLDGAVVAHAVVTTRGAQPAGHPVLRTAFVDAVSTLPSVQGRGYGSQVMRRLGAEIDDYEIGCLQTDKVGFYERLGWELWRGPLAGRGEDGLVPTPNTGVMILRLAATRAVDLDGLLTIELQPERIFGS